MNGLQDFLDCVWLIFAVKRQHSVVADEMAYLVLYFDADLVHGAAAVLGKIPVF